MPRLTWGQAGTRRYETGIDRAVLYIPDNGGNYTNGVAWSGITGLTESPSGAEASPQYADNMKYLQLYSVEEFGATLEAFSYPTEFNQFDGFAEVVPGLRVGQQPRRPFGLSYRTLVGSDTQGDQAGYILHLVYGVTASPSERGYSTVSDSPEPITFSWELMTVPVEAPGYKPTSLIPIDSTMVDATALATLEDILYGTEGSDPRLPLPAEVFALFNGTVTEVVPLAPTFNGTDTITIPSVTGVVYRVNGETVPAGALVITADTIVNAYPVAGYKFPAVVEDEFFFDYV